MQLKLIDINSFAFILISGPSTKTQSRNLKRIRVSKRIIFVNGFENLRILRAE
jgi:hypothetical protein